MAYAPQQPSPYDDFWSKLGPGLFDLGTGIYNRNAGGNEAAARLKTAQGPLYDASMAGAQGMLGQAGNFDPQAFAADRFKASQALVQPVQDRNLDKLMAELRGRGQLGISTFNPGVEGITPNGTAMNPQLAAFYAAQNADNAKRAEASVGQGQSYLDNLLKRSGMLQQQAGRVQDTGITARDSLPSRSGQNVQTIKGIGDVLKNTGVLGQVGGMLGKGYDWLGSQTGMWSPRDMNFGGYGDFAW